VSRELAARFGLGFAPRDGEALRTYLQGLGYDDARLTAAGLYLPIEGSEQLKARFRDRLIFPILDQSGHTVGFGGRLLGPGEPKYLNSAESEVFNKGKLLYHLGAARNAIRKDDRVVIVEGYFDALRLVSVGVEGVVAPMGTALTESQAELLARFTRQVVLCYDSDGPGQKATFRAADLLLAKGFVVRVVTLPEGEDPDTYARSQGGAAVTRLLDEAMDVFDRKVQLLERAGWFADLQHKRQALDRLLPTIRAASDPVTRDLYLARAAEAAGVAREALVAELHAARRGSGPRAAVARPSRGDAGASAGRPAVTGEASGLPAVPAGPYRSSVEQGNAEQVLLRIVLTQPMWRDHVIEELGKLEESERPADLDFGGDPEELGASYALRDPVYAVIYRALLLVGEDWAPEAVAEHLDPLAVRVYEDLRADPQAVFDARTSVADALRQLRGRSVDARLRALESLLPLADAAEKDALTLQIKRLADEKRSLGVQHWGMVRRSR
jgi:DNA primase